MREAASVEGEAIWLLKHGESRRRIVVPVKCDRHRARARDPETYPLEEPQTIAVTQGTQAEADRYDHAQGSA